MSYRRKGSPFRFSFKQAQTMPNTVRIIFSYISNKLRLYLIYTQGEFIFYIRADQGAKIFDLLSYLVYYDKLSKECFAIRII
jgi:hypothetical protein